MADGHEVGLRGKPVIRVLPVAAGEHGQLAGVEDGLNRLLHLGEAVDVVPGPGRADGVSEVDCLLRVGLGCGDHVDKVQRVQVVEVNDVVVDFLGFEDQFTDATCLVRQRDVEGILDGCDAGDGVRAGAHTADAADEGPHVAGVVALDHGLNTAELGGLGPRLRNFLVVCLKLNAEVAFDPGDRVDDYSFGCHYFVPSSSLVDVLTAVAVPVSWGLRTPS